jgi:peptidoglycan/xylan/chitin deacetylase (PgdA/CDA1 family)
MYFGSVKFFKRLIYTVVFGWIGLATAAAVFFGIKYGYALKKIADLSENGNSLAETSEPPEETDAELSVEQAVDAVLANGYEPEDMLEYIRCAYPENFDGYAGLTNEDISGGPEEASPEETAPLDTAPEYAKLYPELYATPPEDFIIKENTVYLTFDDGPSQNTEMILDILKKRNVKATFFFSGGGENAAARMKRAADEGHAIGIHSLSHDYEEIYASAEAFLKDFNDTYSAIYEATGVKPDIFRFAGGSVNNYNRHIYQRLIAEMTRRGFVYYDWNVSGGDAVSGADWSSIYKSVIDGVEMISSGRPVVLLHDGAGKYATVTTVEDIIAALEDKGYEFDSLNNAVLPVTFAYNDG